MKKQVRRDLADGDWWREVCAILGAKLIGWTYRSRATTLYESLNVWYSLNGYTAKTIYDMHQRLLTRKIGS